MPSSDQSDSLRADLVRRWKEELFSSDTVVALVAVAVALPAGLAAAVLVEPGALYAVWFASAVGPTFGYWRGLRIEVDYGTAAKVGLALSLATAVVATGVVALATALAATQTVAVGAGTVVGLLFAGVASQVAFHRYAGRTA
ncbi:hypothetical protein ACFQMA_05795 [Halosimplex aquaticum]|uniref:Uncharacterized protein n=1 Tax=Halosimplex aquaticum TaxID=3026162 RepID=A0ABD5XWC6_9EURY|nr:hypothetical protein [Halosimplex aquaticum]